MNKDKVYIQNFWYVNNYGACLTAFALYKIIQKLEYEVKLIDVSNYGEQLSYKFNDFIKKYCKVTKQIKKISDIEQINDENVIYITGSDQVFRPYLVRNKLKYFLFDYALFNAKKISFSASFGVDKEKFFKETDDNIIKKMKISLKSFDIISCREKSGVEICKDVFNVNSEWIIDPVFILKKDYYVNLAEQSKLNISNNNVIVSCMFDKKDNNLDKFLEKKYSIKVIELWNSNFSIEDWLNLIKNCKFLVTNSYHAMCFAIIFNKPFIALAKDMGASARFESLFEMLNITDQSINNINEIYQKDCIFKIDYEAVNQRIEEEGKKGLDFLKKALEIPTSKKEEKLEARMQFYETKIEELEEQATLKYQIKKELWNLWLKIFYKYLPQPMKKAIIFIRNFKK